MPERVTNISDVLKIYAAVLGSHAGVIFKVVPDAKDLKLKPKHFLKLFSPNRACSMGFWRSLRVVEGVLAARASHVA